ncbi:MAG: membrane protein insertase YidC [Calditrichaeota bacterium]|nr:MAG: membrane protein insertase YidC [Calditrichota bacterium]
MDKKNIILIVILGVFVIFYFQIMEALGLYTPATPQPQTEIVDSTEIKPVDDYTTDSIETRQIPDSDIPAAANAENIKPAIDSIVAADTVVVETNKYIVTLSSHGGGPVSILLKEHFYRDGRKIEMLPNADAVTPDARFAGGTYSTSDSYFTSDISPGTYESKNSNFDITYTYQNDDGSAIIRHYRFHPDSYHYSFALELVEPGKMGLTGKYSLVWNTSPGVTEPQPNTDYEAMMAVTYQGDSFEKLDDYEDNRMRQSLDGTTRWAGVHSKYFASVMIPKSRDAESVTATGSIETIEYDGDLIDKKLVNVSIDMPFANVVAMSDSFYIYVGPLDYNQMENYEVHLEDILDIGTTPFIGWLIKLFAIPIMWILPKMYQFVPNYGLVIILFALMVKIITLPLSMKSFKSMAAMKELQPQLEGLKKKHAKDPQKLNQETMKMYKKHGVNPISGCLPMLPQMPLFFALFAVFRSTILLRDAPFVWFIDDLSRGAASFTDPYMVLVLIMVLAQYASQKVTMGGGTQQNKMFMYIMPLFMGFIFRTFASGLVLYWTCFSVFSLLDYVLFKKNKVKNPEVQ